MNARLPLAIAVALALSAVAAVAPAFAAGTPSPRPSSTKAAERLQDVQKRGDQEVARRLQAIADLSSRVAKAKGLSDSDRGVLQGTLNSAKAGLTALRSRLDSETSVDAALADVKQITVGFRVYSVIDDQVRLAVADDTLIDACTTRLPKIEQDLAAAVAKSASDDAKAKLADLHLQVQTACANANAAHSEIMGLSASAWPGSKDGVQDAKSKLERARTALHVALADAHAILADLHAEKATPTPASR